MSIKAGDLRRVVTLQRPVSRVNEKGLQFYRDLCDALIEAGIKPLVTLYHWDLPTALYKKGGWKNPESPRWFEEYAELVSKALGDRAHAWMTFNEFQIFVGLGMMIGMHAPFERNDTDTLIGVTKNLLLAHGRAVTVLRNLDPEKYLVRIVGITKEGRWLSPSSPAREKLSCRLSAGRVITL